MAVDEEALGRIAGALAADARCMSAAVRIAGRSGAADAVSVRRVSTPVARRTQRGGAYFEDSEMFQARVRTTDPSVPGLAPRVMLGPSAEFADVVVLLEPRAPGAPPAIALHANLTGTVQSGGATELVLAVTGTEASGPGGSRAQPAGQERDRTACAAPDRRGCSTPR